MHTIYGDGYAVILLIFVLNAYAHDVSSEFCGRVDFVVVYFVLYGEGVSGCQTKLILVQQPSHDLMCIHF